MPGTRKRYYLRRRKRSRPTHSQRRARRRRPGHMRAAEANVRSAGIRWADAQTSSECDPPYRRARQPGACRRTSMSRSALASLIDGGLHGLARTAPHLRCRHLLREVTAPQPWSLDCHTIAPQFEERRFRRRVRCRSSRPSASRLCPARPSHARWAAAPRPCAFSADLRRSAPTSSAKAPPRRADGCSPR